MTDQAPKRFEDLPEETKVFLLALRPDEVKRRRPRPARPARRRSRSPPPNARSAARYHYLRERMQQIALPAAVIAAARETFIATPKLKLLLDAEGVTRVTEAIRAAFPDAPPDIVVIDPIRNLFDGGPEGGGENDNTAMMFFLKDRVELLREAVNPDAGVILAHHTRKATKHQVKDDPFLALSGASALRGFYTSGLLMHRPDEDSTVRRLEIELRNGPALPGKLIDKPSAAAAAP